MEIVWYALFRMAGMAIFTVFLVFLFTLVGVSVGIAERFLDWIEGR